MSNNFFPKILYILLWASIWIACTPNRIEDEICLAEKIAPTAPDSAFTILKNIRNEALSDAKLKPDYDLAWAETFYLKNKGLTDSVHKLLSHIQAKPDSKQAVMKQILHAIYLLQNNDTENAFAHFTASKREMNNLIDLYWQCVVEDYLGIICMNSGLSRQSKEHFYQVLKLSEEMKNPKAVSNAYSHISGYYHQVKELDSALYYATKVLKNEKQLDSQMLAIVYHNLYCIQMSIADSAKVGSTAILDLYKRNRVNSEDSLLTIALVTQAYYLRGDTDSALIFQYKVEKSRHNNAKLILYKFLAKHYQEQENTDSAFKYLKLYGKMDSVCLRNLPIESLLSTAHRIEQEEIQEQAKKQKFIILLASFAVLLCIILFLCLRHKRKMSTAFGTIDKLTENLESSKKESIQLQHQTNKQEKEIARTEQEKQQFKDKLDLTKKSLNEVQSELKEKETLLAETIHKIEGYRTIISKKNSRIAQVQRNHEKSVTNAKEQSQTIIQGFLDKSVRPDAKMNKSQMQFITDSYKYSSKERAEFLHSLEKHTKSLTATGVLICILLHEGFTDEEIVTKLHYDPKNFRMAKSRARSAIETPENADSDFIKKLLRKFDYKRSSK